jgi:hypothetical protein
MVDREPVRLEQVTGRRPRASPLGLRSTGAYDAYVATMEQLTSVCGSFEARVLAARLYDEGIDAELRGALDSPYGFTVGEMARIDVYVPTEQAQDAQFVLLAIEVDAATELPEPGYRSRPLTWPFWIVLAAVVVAAVAPLAHLVPH